MYLRLFIILYFSDQDDNDENWKKSLKPKEENPVVHDFATKEFVILCSDDKNNRAYIKYEIVRNGSLHFLTTQVPISQQGKGLGKILVKEALDFCVENQMRFTSSCWYINDYMTKFPSKKYRKLFKA